MFTGSEQTQIAIIPRVYVALEQHIPGSQLQESKPIQSNIPMAWTLDGMDFRLDITLPDPGALEIMFPMEVERLHINGEVIWKNSQEQPQTLANPFVQVHSLNSSGLHLTYASGGPLHILATLAGKSEPMRNETRNGAN